LFPAHLPYSLEVNFFRDSLSEYRELDEPLRRSMRIWWKGPGRLWLLLLSAAGFLEVVCKTWILNSDHITSSGIAGHLWLVAAFLEYSEFMLAVLAWHLTGLSRRSYLQQLSDEAAIPDNASLQRFAFASGLIAGWPVFVTYLLINILGSILMQMAIRSRDLSASHILENLRWSVEPTLLLAFLCCLSIAYISVSSRGDRGFAFLTILLLDSMLLPLKWFTSFGGNLARADELGAVDPSMIILGILTVFLLLGGYFWNPSRGGRGRLLLGLLFGLRFLGLLADAFAAPGNVLSAGGIILQQPLRGIQLVFQMLPFGLGVNYNLPPDQSGEFLTLHWFWLGKVNLPIGLFGYLLAFLLNIIWLFCVFLFCRWAVGRSAAAPLVRL
jgi:hypothetical protein